MHITIQQAATTTYQRMPALLAASAMLIGIACGLNLSYPVITLSLATPLAIMLLLLLYYRQQHHPRNTIYHSLISIATLFFMLGLGRASWQLLREQHELAYFSAQATPATFQCRVGYDIQTTPLKGRAARHRFTAADVTLIRPDSHNLQLHTLPLEVNWYGALEESANSVPQPDNLWRFSGRAQLSRRRNGSRYLKLNTGEGKRSTWLAKPDPRSWCVRLHSARQSAAQRITLGIDDWGAVPALNQAMLLGLRHEMPPDLRRIFADSGTIHVFAISGLHVAMVTTVLVLLVSMLGVKRMYWFFAVAPLLILYTATTGARPSAVRACMMALMILAAPIAERRANGLAALSMTILIVHFLRPRLIYDIGNILSFSVMGGLIILCQPLALMLRNLTAEKQLKQWRLLYARGGHHKRAQQIYRLNQTLRWLTDSFAVSFAAWLTSVPLTAYYFGRFSPGGLVANLVVVPCAFMIVTASTISYGISFVSSWVANCFNHAAGLFTTTLIHTASWAASWGGFKINKWQEWQVWLWFTALVALAIWLHRKTNSSDMQWLNPTDKTT